MNNLTNKMSATGLGLSLGLTMALTLGAAPARAAEDPYTVEYRAVLPFDMPATEVLRQSEHKVFPHWHNFSVSYDNQAPDQDKWATDIFSLSGAFTEKSPNSRIGGFSRQRPLPRAPRAGDDWSVQDAMQEVRYAIAAGIDGFYFNTLGPPGSGQYAKLTDHLEAARRVDAGFKILPAVDAAGVNPKEDTEKSREYFYTILMSVKDHPSILRTADGRMVFGCFFAQNLSPQDWQWITGRMEQNGVKTAFIPVFLGYRNAYRDYLPVAYGIGDWGAKIAGAARVLADAPDLVHQSGKMFFYPVAVQQVRPKSNFYNEAQNSYLFRESFTSAIQSHADWVQVVTWNDYGEGTEIAPSTGTQFAPLDLTAYYTTWFKTGQEPKVVRDVLYYFHRIHSVNAKPVSHKGMGVSGGTKPSDDIEMVAFLKEPGELGIEVGGEKKTMEAPAGVTSFRVPLREGTPVFTLTRGGQEVIHLTSAFEIKNSGLIFQNMLYHAGGSNRPPVPGIEDYKLYYQK